MAHALGRRQVRIGFREALLGLRHGIAELDERVPRDDVPVASAEVWGLAIDPVTGIIYLSDMRTGLWIVRPTGPAAS